MNATTPASSRRSFLKLSGAALAGAALLRSSPSFALATPGAAGGDAEYGNLPMGLQSYTLRSLSFDNTLKAMRDELKLTRVELFPQHLSGMSPPQALQKMKDAGVTAVSYGVVPFTKDHEANRKLFEFAKTFGMSNLACDPDRDAFDSLDKLCDEYDITAAIHPHGPGSKWFEIKQIFDAVKDHNPKIGLCNDTGHLIRANQDPVEACSVFKGRLHDIHFKDFKKKPDGGWEDCVLGEGELKVDALTKALIDMNYKGVIALEYEGGDPVNASKKCLDRIKQAAAKAKQA